MVRFNIFDDDRKIPNLSMNIKVCVKTENQEELTSWNTAFGYIMKKPRTKLEFLAVDPIRELNLSKVSLDSIRDFIKQEDYYVLHSIEDLFNNRLNDDTKAFILSVIKVPYQRLCEICE